MNKKEFSLIQKAQNDPKAFAPLYNANYEPIFYFIFRRIQDHDITCDLTSQVFLKALLNIKRYKYTGAPFLSWLYRIALNEVNTYYRNSKKTTFVSIQEYQLKNISSQLDEKNQEINLQKLLKGLTELDYELCQLIDLRFFEERSFKEIGEIFSISEDNAKTRTYRVIKKLKALLNK